MQLTKENTLKLYHYCVSIADALRPFLNTPNDFEKAEPEYWIPKLTEFRNIINETLGVQIVSPILSSPFVKDLFGEGGFNQIVDLFNSIRKSQTYENIFNRTLQTILKAGFDHKNYGITEKINSAIIITEEVIEKLEEQKK